MNKITIGLDVYGTLVDPKDIGVNLQNLIGEKAKLFAEILRQKQLEYTFRRGLMNQYKNFDICIQHAIEYANEYLDVRLSRKEKNHILDFHSNLGVFPDVIPAIKQLTKSNHTLVAFSNGVEPTLQTLLSNIGLVDYLSDIISVDELQTFKPSPKVYNHLAKKTKAELINCWVVSSNPFDIIGAKAAGLKAAWIQRDSSNIYDPWEYIPDITVNNLIEFADFVQ